ncbi:MULTISPECIES: CD1375 family protein [Exiguobacterium]|nr:MULTISPECIES: CD1375 family protein [Exiguobacterium]
MDESQLTTLEQLAIGRYVVLIRAEWRTLESVPEKLRPYVEARLEAE